MTKAELCRVTLGPSSLYVLHLAESGFSPALARPSPPAAEFAADGTNVNGLLKRGLVYKTNGGIIRITEDGQEVLKRYLRALGIWTILGRDVGCPNSRHNNRG